MDAWSDFIRGWLEASNPWRAAFTDGSNELEVRTLCMFVFFITLHVTMMFLKKRGLLRPSRKVLPPLLLIQL